MSLESGIYCNNNINKFSSLRKLLIKDFSWGDDHLNIKNIYHMRRIKDYTWALGCSVELIEDIRMSDGG